MKKYIVFMILTSVFFCQSAWADFYKWVDENGETRITDYPPPQNKAAKDVEVHKAQTAPPPVSEQADGAAKNKPAKKADVSLYTKNNCPDCDKAREFLTSKNIVFTEYNMDDDANAAAKRKEIDDGDDVPFAVINRSQVHGFSDKIYEKVLKTEQ